MNAVFSRQDSVWSEKIHIFEDFLIPREPLLKFCNQFKHELLTLLLEHTHYVWIEALGPLLKTSPIITTKNVSIWLENACLKGAEMQLQQMKEFVNIGGTRLKLGIECLHVFDKRGEESKEEFERRVK